MGLSFLILYLNIFESYVYMERERTSGGPNGRLEVSLLLQLCIPGIQGIFLAQSEISDLSLEETKKGWNPHANGGA